jgi:hypothetical protein
MNLRFISLALYVALLSSANPSLGQQKSPTFECEARENSVYKMGATVASEAHVFLLQLQQAVKADDKNALASLMNYPLRAQLNGKSMSVKTNNDFKRSYNEIITPAIKAAILAQDPNCLSYASSGFTPEDGSEVAIAIGKGELWFNSVGSEGTMKVITINNVDY